MNELIDKKVVIKHKYKIPYEKKFYNRNIDKNPNNYMRPLYNKDYYLLDHNNGYFNYRNFIDNFFTGDHNDFSDKSKKGLIKIMNESIFIQHLSECFTNILEPYKEFKSYEYDHSKLYLYRSDEFFRFQYHSTLLSIWKNRLERELKLIAIKEKVNLNISSPFYDSKSELSRLEECLEYFLKKYSFSTADFLIRCSTECILLNLKSNTTRQNNYTVYFKMVDYEHLLCYLFNTGHKLP